MEISKICTKCHVNKEITDFVISKTIKSGYCSVCKICMKDYKKKHYVKNIILINEKNKKYYLENKNKIRINQNKKYKNDEIFRNKIKEYEKNNSDKIKKQKLEYKIKNKEQIRLKTNEYRKNKKETNKLYFLTCKIRGMISKAIKRKNLVKNNNTFNIIGCDNVFLKEYIESKWYNKSNLNDLGEVWMNWDNYGKYKYGVLYYGWDIDHIIPLSSSLTEEDVIKLNHYTNLQPLCSYINRNVKGR